MSITSAKSGATGISLALDNNFMEPIATTLVGSGGSSSIIFNDIPQTYKHLQIRIFDQLNNGSYGAIAWLRFNGDAATNYSGHLLYGTGTSAGAGANVSLDRIQRPITAGGANASIFGAAILDVLDYSNTNKNKTVRMFGGVDFNAVDTGYICLFSGAWLNTAPITNFSLDYGGTTYKQYTRVSLYGIKG